jgi:hypothetical protein
LCRAACAAAAVLASTVVVVAAGDVYRGDIDARRIDQFLVGSNETRFGALEFVGGLEMVSRQQHFGALSAIRFIDAGQNFLGVADTGFWYSGRVERDGEMRPAGFSDFLMREMPDRSGGFSGRKWETDAEGLALTGPGSGVVSFERDHRVVAFDYTSLDTTQPAMGRSIDFLVPTRELRQNRGFETLAKSTDDSAFAGALIGVTEKSLNKAGDIFAAVFDGPRKGIFFVKRVGDYDVTDGAFLPDGDLLLLEREFSMATGVAMRLRRIAGDTITKGATVDGPIILEADMRYQIDNMEGLDVWTRADGATMISLVSDDNHSILQRNLYLEFRYFE